MQISKLFTIIGCDPIILVTDLPSLLDYVEFNHYIKFDKNSSKHFCKEYPPIPRKAFPLPAAKASQLQ